MAALSTAAGSANDIYPTLNVTAITTLHGESIFECWSLIPGFVQSNQTGTAGAQLLQLGNLANASFSILPPNFSGGRHNAPNVQWVSFLSGVAHISLPNSTADAWVVGGPHGLIVATDIVSESIFGHITDYPSKQQTRTLQIPTLDGAIPGHKVLHRGPCEAAVSQKRARAILELEELD